MVKLFLTEYADLVSVLLFEVRSKEVKSITFHTDFSIVE